MNPLLSYQDAGPIVQLFILSRDRRDFCREAVASAVAQRYARCEVIVSDNSTGEDVAEMLSAEFPDVKLVRRRPNLTALSHFNRLIEEAHAPLMVMFHDDDVLEPDYVERMVGLLSKHSDVAAVGCNARAIRGKIMTREMLMGNFRGVRLIEKPVELLEPYLSLNLIDPAPFPGYMYRTEMIKGLMLDYRQGGKHSDVSFLCQVVARAPVLWTAECLFNYRIHDANDSRNESIADRLSWLRYIQKTTGLSRRSRAIMDYKFIYWRRWILQNSMLSQKIGAPVISTRRKHAIVHRFVVFHGLRMAFTRLDFWLRTWRMLTRSLGNKKGARGVDAGN